MKIENITKTIQLKYVNNDQNKISLDEFFSYDSSKLYKKSASTTFIFERFEKKMNAITKELTKTDQLYDCFIFTDDDTLIKPCEINDLGSFNIDKIERKELINFEFYVS